MKNTHLLTLAALIASAWSIVMADEKRDVLGRRIHNFVLPDSAGNQVALSDFNDARSIVVIFIGTRCPIGNAFVPVLNDLQHRYRDQGVAIIGINANPSDSAEAIAEHVKEFNVAFPVLVDRQQVVADLFAADRRPEAFLLDRNRQVRYRGRIDDRFGFTYKRDEPQRHDLIEAIDEVLGGKEVSVKQTEVQGCLINRRSRIEDPAKITFTKHVARILQRRCAQCHHEDTAAPFSLLSFEDADNWSEMIRETVIERRMPPWDADPRHGDFSNDLRMTTEEIDTVMTWIDNGKPRGDDKDLPTPFVYEPGWMIGKPDVVFRMPETFTVQASGTVDYQYFVTPTNFKEDMWVQASEARPGNWDAVHHIIAYVREDKSKGLRNLPAVAGYAPGEEPMIYPQGTGFLVKAGAEIVWQVHYTPTGKVETDCSAVGLIFCKQPPKRRIHGGGAFNLKFEIPAGADNFRVESSKRFDRDVELLSLMPHMHLRGKDFRYTAKYPDGSEKILLSVPRYDFNWQHRYRFTKPEFMPKGTTLHCVAHFDNSANNPANPDPSKPVRWGEQTWEEMMIGFYSYVDALPDDRQQPNNQP